VRPIRYRAFLLALTCIAAFLAAVCGHACAAAPDTDTTTTKPAEDAVPGGKAIGEPVLVDGVYLIVDKQVITVSEIARKVEPYIQRLKESGTLLGQQEEIELRARVFSEVAEGMKIKALVLKAARDKGMMVDEARVGSQIRRLLVREGQTIEEYLEKNKMTYRELYQEMQDDIMFSAFRQIQIMPRIHVTPGQIKAYFDEHKAEFDTPTQVHCHQLVILKGSKEEKQQKAKAALEQLRAGGKFADVARTFSESETARDGGDVGWIARGELFNSEKINATLFDELKIGAISDIVEDEHGFLWIVMISERREAAKASLATVYTDIETRLRRVQIEQETRKYAQRIEKTTAVVYPSGKIH